ncbi:autotransporter-associated beta strand repeat-containing protein [Akkermansia muciniphila]|uniref:autotransporter-associated beta strand repeat-containing protein n=2 Tax=Akkermansia muciniphila TaxID=239935 RepID=UPI0016021BCD|nr:autotransporter-associated beta strand repeat-containing protein [Akkermansia muciniphila]QNB42772.1 autotransporter-associated beta strand repeat-containing protein [Akkermansia muciniphila]
MKLHLPVTLLSAVLACYSVAVLTASAETLTSNVTISTDTTWNETTTIGANGLTLTIETGKTLTQAEGAFNIGNNSLTITGGGVFRIETAATQKIGSDPISKTLTINNATLDLSAPDASLNSGGYTRCRVTVTDGGVLRVGEYSYNGLGQMATNTDYWTLNNKGRLELTKEENGEFGCGLTVAAGGGAVEVENASSTVRMTVSSAQWIQLNGALTLTGAGNMTTAGDNVFRGTGRLIKDGSGTLTLAHASSFTGGVELKGGTLIVSHASGMGTNKNLSVTGNAAIGGISAGYGGISLSAGAGLDVSAVDSNAGLSMTAGVLSLGGQNTMTGNLNLGAAVRIDATHMTVNGNPLLVLNGALTVNGSLLLENSDSVSWSAGTYNLINATGGITGDLANTILLGTEYIGNWSTTDNTLKFVVAQVTSLTWTGGGDNTWTVGGTGDSPWNAGLPFANGNGVIFGDVAGNAPQTVNIAGQVNPGLIVVNADATGYTWTGSGSLVGSSKLQKTGSGTLSIATDNAGFSGEVLLGGGTVEMRHDAALGAGSIIFNGGSLKYGAGITADISGQIQTGALASNAVLVDTNGNAVTWASLAGWMGTITRTGEGSLNLAAGAYGGKLINSGAGSLVIGAGNATLGGGISGTVVKTGDGTLSLSRDAFNASGDGTLVIESGTLDLLTDGATSNVLSANLNITLGENAVMKVSHAFTSITGTGTLTMGNGSKLRLWNGNTWADRSINMQIRLDAGEGGYAIIDGAANGNNATLTSAITGTGGLKIISDVGGNGWNFKTGWVKNSYDGDTEIAGTGGNISLTYNVGTASVAAGQVLTPWGQGSVTLGGSEKNVTVTFNGLNAAAAAGGVSLDGDVTLKGTNAATVLNVFIGITGTATLNGKVSVETSGTGTATIASGDSLKMLGGLGGTGTLAVNTRNNAGALTLGGDVSGFSGTLYLSGANLYLNADTPLAGTLNASTAKVTALRKQNVTGTLNAASLAVDGSALSSDGATLTVSNLALGVDAGVSLDINGNITAGTYTLVSWDNLTAGNFADAGTMTLTGTLASLYQGTFNVNTGDKTVTVSVSMADGVVVWDGNPIGAVDNTTTYLFDGTHTGVASLTGDVNAKAIYFNNGIGQDLELTNNGGKLAGNGAMTKLGEGKVTFNSSNNDYSGAVNIKEGTVAVKANMALGTGTVTVDRTGRLEIGVTGGIADILGATMPTINGGTIAFASGRANTLGKLLTGSGINLEVSGAGTALTVSTAQTKTALTTVGEGAVLNLGKNGDGQQSILYGDLIVNGGTLNTTAGDPFGYNNNGNFGTLTLNSGTWNVSGGNTTMANTRMVFNNSRVILNMPGGGLNGFDLFSGTNTIVTQQSATGMSVFSVAEGVPSTGQANALTLRGGTAIFDIARGNFALDDTNTADLKLDVIVAKEGNGANLVKQGNGVLQLTKASDYTNQTLIKEGTILLTGAGSLGSGAVTLGGLGDAFLTYAVDSEQTVANVIGGTGTITQQGGQVTMSGNNTYEGLTIVEDGTLVAGSASAFGLSTVTVTGGVLDMNGQALTNGITVSNGTLSRAGAYAATGGVQVEAGEQNTVTTQGLASSALSSVILAAGARLDFQDEEGNAAALDMSGKKVVLTLGTGNVSVSAGEPGEAMIGASSLTLTGNETEIDLSNGALVDLLKTTKDSAEGVRLLLTTGTLSFSDADTYRQQLQFSPLLSSLGYAVTGTDGGALLTSGNSNLVYLVTGGEGSYPPSIADYPALDAYKAVVLDSGKSLNVALSGAPDNGEGLHVRNLVGLEGSSLRVTNSDMTENAIVILDNAVLNPELDSGVTDPARVGTDTIMGGSIIGGEAVTFIKEGAGTLTVGGTMDVETLALREGTIVLNGASNTLGALTLEGGGLTINGNAEVGTITGTEAGGTLTIQGTLNLTGTGEINDGTLTGSGILRIREGAELALGGEARLDGTSVTADGTLTLTGTESGAISGLTGSGALSMNGGSLSISSATTSSGTFSGTLAGRGALKVSGGMQTLAGTGNADYTIEVFNGTLLLEHSSGTVSYGAITVGDQGRLTLGSTGTPNCRLELGSGGLAVQSGGTLTINLDAATMDQLTALMPVIQSQGNISLEDGATVVTHNLNAMTTSEMEHLSLTLFTSTEGTATLGEVTLQDDILSSMYNDLRLEVVGSSIILTGTARQDNVFAASAETFNSTSGANLLWGGRFNLGVDSQLKTLYNAVLSLQSSGDRAGASRAMAAAAGSTVNALGTAQRDALRDQMGWIRNRTTLMGVNPAYVNDDLPRFHMWMEGTGSYAKLDTRGDESGYQLTTWGGTVGVDADLSDRLTVGAAFTAGYGDLTASAADSADGHLDSYYASLFGRYQNKRWAHTLILTGGWNDAKLNRTVNYGEGSYGTQGSTSGWGLGAMYELTYDVYLDENRSSVLQPLFNASVVTTRMDGYEETGAGNAGLNVGRQDWTTGTLALGGRWMGLVGSNIFGRESLAEIRVNAAQDLGDRRGETNVSLLGNPGFAQSVRGAKTGTAALQLGAGLSVPVGTKGTIYVNGNADIRDGSSALNGSVGYRYDF